MYQITAVFNKHCLNDVLKELYDNGIEGVTVMDVVGKGGSGQTQTDGQPDLYEKVMLLIVVSNDHFKETAMEAIRSNTQDLEHGAGKMWVTPVLEVERIRTGEKNADALTTSQNTTPHETPSNTFFTAVDTPAT